MDVSSTWNPRWKGTHDRPAVLVIGGGHIKSIGFAICELLMEKGVLVFSADIVHVNAQTVPTDDVPGVFNVDASSEDSIEHLMTNVRAVADGNGMQLVGVVYAAGYNRIGAVEDYALRDFEQTIRLNLTAPWLVVKHLVREYGNLRNRRAPMQVVILGSNTSYIAKTRTSAYGASKAGVVHMAACLHRELAPQHYRITVLNFGPVDGTMMDAITRQELQEQRGWDRDDYNEQITKNIPLRRMTTRYEVAEFAYFALTQELLGGRALNFDGGQQQG